MIEYLANTCIGLSHVKNEDRIMINDNILSTGLMCGKTDDKIISIICDGVGSSLGGDIAAELIVREFDGFLNNKISPATISRKLNNINYKIRQIQKCNPSVVNMASTIAGIIIINNSFISFNLGDTRIYSYYSGKLEIISEDHIPSKSISNTTSNTSNSINRYLGGSINACYPTIKKGYLFNESYMMICSDGFYKHISDNRIKHILNLDNTFEEKQRIVLNLCIQNGALDDASFVLIRFKL